MSRSLHALGAGLWLVMRAPGLLAGITLLTIAAAAPFGVVLGSQIQESLATQPLIDLGSSEIDAEWWLEFREQAPGLAATFTPTIVGFAAPLDNLSALLDGSPRPLILALPVVAFALLWALLWGGLLHRFHAGRRMGPRQFWSAAWRAFPANVTIGATAALVNLILFLTVHAVLFGPIFSALASRAATERDAFLWRVFLYGVFGCLLALVGLIADYARVHVASASAASARLAIIASAGFVRRNRLAVAGLYVFTGVLFVLLVAAYGTVETTGGFRFIGWRGVILGQLFIVGRLALRLTFGASEVWLYARLTGVGRPGEAGTAAGDIPSARAGG
jgi:hypothetical protein